MEPKRHKKRYNFTLNRLTDERLDELAELTGYSRSELIQIAIKKLHKSVMKKKQADE